MSFNRFVLLERYPPMRQYTQCFIYVFFIVQCISCKGTATRVYFSINRTRRVVTIFYPSSELQARSNLRLQRTECEIKKRIIFFFMIAVIGIIKGRQEKQGLSDILIDMYTFRPWFSFSGFTNRITFNKLLWRSMRLDRIIIFIFLNFAKVAFIP